MMVTVENAKAGKLSKKLERTMFSKSSDAMLREFETEQVLQLICASLVVETYALNDNQIIYMFFKLNQNGTCPVTFTDGGQILQQVLSSSRKGKNMWIVSVPTLL